MKSWLMMVAGLLLAGVLGFMAMAFLSQKQPDTLGLQHGMLRGCPDTPNCVCSEVHTKADAAHFIAPMAVNEQTWADLKELMAKQGGKLESSTADYMHLIFSTPIFHYVDDVELRFDRKAGLLHFRSASRVGHSDFGVNRKRIEAIKKVVGAINEY